MMCCDTCEDWFHGKCVGITEATGSRIDKWACTKCRKEKKTEKETLQTPVAARGRRRRGRRGQLKSHEGVIENEDEEEGNGEKEIREDDANK